VKRAVALGQPISLLIVDADHFKGVNDRHGHSAGDEALRQIARAMSLVMRGGDRLYRYGGEEFVVVCDGLGHDAARVAAERLRRAVAATTIPHIDRQVTVSIGIATSSEDGVDCAELFGTADARLYAAKEAGRNRVIGRPQQAEEELPQSRQEKRSA
jgi:diguanylate cyclase (GGDEF)-like protein